MREVRRVHVLKFGSSVLARPSAYRSVAEEIRAEVAGGANVLAVVSAMGDTTDDLLAAAREVAPSLPDDLMGSLLATGEEASVALLRLALATAGVRAVGMSFWHLPVRTRGPLGSADPVAVDARRIETAFTTHDAVILPGFVGVDATGVTSLLGRGGSDLTALFLGHALGAAEVRLVKDVDGIFPADPKRFPNIAPLRAATWSEARRTAGGVVQDRALRFAEDHRIPFRVAAPGGTGTWVGRHDPTHDRNSGRKASARCA